MDTITFLGCSSRRMTSRTVVFLTLATDWSVVRGVAGHEEVEPGRGDERGDEANEVVVHVAGVAQGGGAG